MNRKSKVWCTLALGMTLMCQSPIWASSSYGPVYFDASVVFVDKDTYIKIEPDVTEGIRVEVNGSSFNVHQQNDDNYYYRVTEAGGYEITVISDDGERTYNFLEVSLEDKAPELKLSRVHTSKGWCIKVTASDDHKIKEVRMDDTTLAFPEEGGSREYIVTESKTYTVEVEDERGNKTLEKIYIDVEQKEDELEVELSKEYREDGWYLMIKAKDNYEIVKVTVEGKEIDFNPAGETKAYKVNQTDSYEVKVTDDDGNEVRKSLYINIKDKVSIPPVLKIEQRDQEDGSYLSIHIEDNGKLEQVMVNQEPLVIQGSEQDFLYKLQKAGIYEVVVVDDEGNTVKDTIALKEINQLKTKQTVVFKAGSTTWYKNGVAQESMEVAPSIHNGKIYLPLRYVAKAIGIDEHNISWDSQAQQAMIKDGSLTLIVPLKGNVMQLNGQHLNMDAMPIMQQGRVLLPLSTITKAFEEKDIRLSWDNGTKEVTILSE